MRRVVILLLLSSWVSAHELTPTYPSWSETLNPEVLSTKVTLFNRRQDVQFFAVGIYDNDWQKVPFAASDRLLRVPYLEARELRVYIQKEQIGRAVYICTRSKILKGIQKLSAVSSTICSKTR